MSCALASSVVSELLRDCNSMYKHQLCINTNSMYKHKLYVHAQCCGNLLFASNLQLLKKPIFCNQSFMNEGFPRELVVNLSYKPFSPDKVPVSWYQIWVCITRWHKFHQDYWPVLLIIVSTLVLLTSYKSLHHKCLNTVIFNNFLSRFKLW